MVRVFYFYSMSHFAIIVAGGAGSRMNVATPKQFLLLKGKPILMHTILKFDSCEIIVVLPEDHVAHWKLLCTQYDFDHSHTVVNGGATRFQSVKNGLRLLPETGLVAIHDGVRPLVTQDIIRSSFELAQQAGNAITSMPLKDSIRQLTKDGNQAVDRSKFQLIQTPQTFDIPLIKKAYERDELPSFTDDASVSESAGHMINLLPGSYANIKITTSEDLKIAEALLNGQ